MDGMMHSAFEAAPLRYVHDVLTGEFVSLGVVVLCPDRAYLGCRFLTSFRRVRAVFPDMDRVQVNRVCNNLSDALAEEGRRMFSELPFEQNTQSLSQLLARLLPPNDAALQFPPTIASGITSDPERTLSELFERYAARHRDAPARLTRGDEDVWRPLAASLKEKNLLGRLQEFVLKGDHHYELPLRHAWRNGNWNAIQPISLDLSDPREIRDRAVWWSGRLSAVEFAKQDLKLRLLMGLPGSERPRGVRDAANDAMDILKDRVSREAEIVPETQGPDLVARIVSDLAEHSA